MFVALNGQRIPLTLGRWNAAKAIQAGMTCTKNQALIDLVASSGLDEAAKELGVEPEKLRRKLDQAKAASCKARKLATADLPILDLIDELGYAPEKVAEILEIPLREVRGRYWRARNRLRTERHDEALARELPQLCQRDFMAFELHVVLNYSIGSAARILGLNRGHMVRRIQLVREILRTHCQADTPNAKT